MGRQWKMLSEIANKWQTKPIDESGSQVDADNDKEAELEREREGEPEPEREPEKREQQVGEEEDYSGEEKKLKTTATTQANNCSISGYSNCRQSGAAAATADDVVAIDNDNDGGRQRAVTTTATSLRAVGCSSSSSSNNSRSTKKSQRSPTKSSNGKKPLLGSACASLQLVNLDWSKRITIILIGASLLFSVFFALEFFIAKLATLLSEERPIWPQHEVTAGTQTNPSNVHWSKTTTSKFNANNEPSFSSSSSSHSTSSTVWSKINWQSLLLNRSQFCASSSVLSKSSAAITTTVVNETMTNLDNPLLRATRSKLGVNFELIYEHQSDIDRVQPELRLGRLLGAYHAAMPFNPDIWMLSEPIREHMYLLTGNLRQCRHQLSFLLQEIAKSLDNERYPRGPLGFNGGQQHASLMQLLDSYGRPEAGTLNGHPFWLGSYLECAQIDSKIRLNDSPNSSYNHKKLLETRYCVAKFAFKDWLTRADQKVSSLKVGVCLPKQCDSLALFKQQLFNVVDEDYDQSNGSEIDLLKKQIKRLAMINFNERLYPSDELQLRDVYCLPLDESRTLSAGAFMLLLFMIVWCAALVACTWIRRKRLADQMALMDLIDNKWLDIMSIETNFERFIESENSLREEEKTQNEGEEGASKLVNLNVLNSVKHFGCVGVIAAHVLLTHLTLGTGYSHIVETIGRDLRTMLLLSLNNVVDTFFVISGLLVAYLTFKRMDQQTWSTSSSSSPSLSKQQQRETSRQHESSFMNRGLRAYLYIVAGRYLRMAPLYFLVYTFVKTIAVHLGSGPLWDYATNVDSLRGSCRSESWLWPLTFASDFKPISQHCIPAAWSISVDLHFFLILPLFVAALRRWPTSAFTLMCCLIVGSTAYTLNDYKSLLDYVSLSDFAKLRLHVFTVLVRHVAHAYSQPQNRLGPMLIGFLGGYLLYRYEKKKHHHHDHHQLMRLAQQEPHNNNAAPKQNTTMPLPVAADGSKRWPNVMRGKYFGLIIVANLLFILAPCIVQLRERARLNYELASKQQHQHQLDANDSLMNNYIIWPLLRTSIEFDCYLALYGFVLIKPLWSICNCVFFLRMTTDLSATLIGRVMSMKLWRIVSKLNYAILLIHFELIAYEAMSRLSLSPISWINLLCKFAFAYLSSLLLAVPLYVLFEQPMHRLTSAWMNYNKEPAYSHRFRQ